MVSLARFVSVLSRRTFRAEGHVFAVTPERVGIAEGVRAALAMAPLLVAAILLARPEIALGAVAAFWNCLCDPQGSRMARLKAMGTFTIMGAIVLPVASWVAHWGYLASLVILFALVFLCGLTRSYKAAFGPMPAQAGFIATLAVVIGIASARPLTGALELGGYFLLGSLWTMLFCVFLVPIPFRQSGNLMLAAIFARLESMAGFIDELGARPEADIAGWQTFDLVHRRGVRLSIERGRALAALDSCNGLRVGAYIDAAGRIFSALIAIGHAQRKSPQQASGRSRQLLRALQQCLQALADEALLDGPLPDARVAQANALLQQVANQHDVIARCVQFAASAIVRLAEQGVVPAAGSGQIPLAAAPATRGIDTMVWRHALRVALATVVAFAIGTWLNVTLAYWGALAAIVVTQPVAANTWLRILERACGSVLGGSIAAALLATLPGPGAMVLAILPLAAVAIACRLVSYGLFVVFLCPMFMLLSDFIHPAGGLIAARFANEVIGACVGVAVSFLLWPGRNEDVLDAAIGAAISANMDFASAALRMDGGAAAELDRLQREAGLASTRLETARERMLLEGRWRSAGLERLREVIVALRFVCGAAAVVEVLREGEPNEAERQRAQAYDAMAAQMRQALASKAGGQISAAKPAAHTDDDLGEAIDHLAGALNAYVALPT
ncbi:FUSC family protein [Paraburkholderia bannensis]|uniref:FUSC family protein n=1 Tax=Paraburkholderia bannensis TaxID=765414 RepID=UPI002AC35473|nr:FUSC family protein [Paraburkholderia bannensis]